MLSQRTSEKPLDQKQQQDGNRDISLSASKRDGESLEFCTIGKGNADDDNHESAKYGVFPNMAILSNFIEMEYDEAHCIAKQTRQQLPPNACEEKCTSQPNNDVDHGSRGSVPNESQSRAHTPQKKSDEGEWSSLNGDNDCENAKYQEAFAHSLSKQAIQRQVYQSDEESSSSFPMAIKVMMMMMMMMIIETKTMMVVKTIPMMIQCLMETR